MMRHMMRHCWAQPLLADPRLFFESRMAATPAAATAPELTAASPPAPPEPALTLTEYSSLALETAVYPNRGANVPYAVLGLVGEAGEVADKVKKVMRDRDGCYDADAKTQIAKELGDVMWYAAALADELGYSLEEIARMNLRKLADRRARNVIHGSGDDR